MLKSLFYLFSSISPLLAQETTSSLETAGEQAKTGLILLSLLIAVPVLIAAIFLIRFLYKSTIGEKRKTTVMQDYQKEAEQYENAGKFVSAAAVYEKKLKNYKKAAALYEKGKDYKRAAELYQAIGLSEKSKEMYEKEGNIEDAAEVSMLDGEFVSAALLYKKAGKKIDAAQALEAAGNKLAAVGAYREAGDYTKASQLLEEEGMLREAAEMFSFLLRGKKLDSSTIDDFYTYALKLQRAGDEAKAASLFQDIYAINPSYKDVRERIPVTQEQPYDEKEFAGKTPLRGFIKSGRIEPKHSLKLWLSILKELQEAYKRGHAYGLLSPDNILIDSKNKISFLKRNPIDDYIAPEIIRGIQPDERSDVYSAGIILYEMLVGSLHGLGSDRVIDIVHDVPDWLDDMVIKCIRKVKEDRYKNIDAIFDEIKAITKSRKEQ